MELLDPRPTINSFSWIVSTALGKRSLIVEAERRMRLSSTCAVLNVAADEKPPNERDWKSPSSLDRPWKYRAAWPVEAPNLSELKVEARNG